MGLVSEVVFSEPTFVGQLGGVLLHISLWFVFGNMDWGVMGMVERWVKARSWYPIVQKNYKDDAAQKVYKYDDPGDNFVAFVKTAWHHAWGGSLMVAGMVTGQTWLWRHGMLTEVGGLDLLELLLVLHCKLRPPGTRPTSDNLKSPTYLGLIFFHHSVGLCVGVPVNLYFAHIFEFQLFGLVILGGPSLCCMLAVLLKTWDEEAHPRIALFNVLQKLVIFCIGQRVLYYFPAAYSRVLAVWHDPVCTWSLFVPFAYAVVAMSLFNLLVLVIFASGLKQAFAGKTPEDKAVGKKLLHHASTMGFSAHAFNGGIGHSREFTNIFVASRMVGLAEKAKKKVSAKHE